MKENTHSPLVLIVDDTISNLQLLGTMLNEEHYNLAIAENGPIGVINRGYVEVDNSVKFFVKDNGIGIAENIKDKLFRLDDIYIQYGTNNEVGLGLGLIICKTLVDLQGGEIWFDSNKYNGTTFYFTLPKYSEQNGNSIH